MSSYTMLVVSQHTHEVLPKWLTKMQYLDGVKLMC